MVTGLIKANFPARISFAVASSIDSRVILDTTGAETLLGRGDMLFLPPEASGPVRCQGVMVSDQEVEKIITFWQKAQPASEPEPAPWEDLLAQDSAVADRDGLAGRGHQDRAPGAACQRFHAAAPAAHRLSASGAAHR